MALGSWLLGLLLCSMAEQAVLGARLCPACQGPEAGEGPTKPPLWSGAMTLGRQVAVWLLVIVALYGLINLANDFPNLPLCKAAARRGPARAERDALRLLAELWLRRARDRGGGAARPGLLIYQVAEPGDSPQ